MSEHPLQIIELDLRLANDPNGLVLKSLVDRLSTGKRAVQRELDQGVSSSEHARLTTLVAAYSAGIDALPKLWACLNEGGR